MADNYSAADGIIQEGPELGIFKLSGIGLANRGCYLYSGNNLAVGHVGDPAVGLGLGVLTTSGADGDEIGVYGPGAVVKVTLTGTELVVGEQVIITGAGLFGAAGTAVAISGSVYTTFYPTGMIKGAVGKLLQAGTDADESLVLLR